MAQTFNKSNKSFNRDPRRFQPEEPFKINERIRVPEVRLVGEGIEPGIYEISKALAMAAAQGLDLVEIAPTATPPVCKITDYSKFKYEQKKKQKEIKAKAAKVVVKEVRFSPNTDDHDFDFKLKHAVNFLKEGAKVKVFVQFKGREIVFKDIGYKLIERFLKGLEEVGKPDQEPRLEGKRLSVMVAPKASMKAAAK